MLFVKRSFAFHLLFTPTIQTIQKTTLNTSSRRFHHHHLKVSFFVSFVWCIKFAEKQSWLFVIEEFVLSSSYFAALY